MADAQLEPAAESEVEPELGDETETLAQETESDALVADEDLLASVESAVDEVQPELLGATQDVPPTQSLANKAFDEEALHDWLSDNPDGEKPFSFDRPLDAKTIDSAGMDIDAMLQMGGEDWNGFHLTQISKRSCRMMYLRMSKRFGRVKHRSRKRSLKTGDRKRICWISTHSVMAT